MGYFCPECGTQNVAITEPPPKERKDEYTCKTDFDREIELVKQKTEQERSVTEKVRQETELARIKLEQSKIDKQKEDEKRKEKERKKAVREQNKEKRQANLSYIMGLISIVTMGCLFFTEILGIKYALLSKVDGNMYAKAKIGMCLSIISIVCCVIVIVVSVIFS